MHACQQMEAAGYAVDERFQFLPIQSFQVFRPGADDVVAPVAAVGVEGR